jgi:hypothetical protein
MGPLLKSFLLLGLVGLVGFLGTARCLPRYNTPTSYKIQLETTKKANYRTFPVPESGNVTIDVPRLPRSCSWDWFCFTVIDGSPETRRLISIVRDGKVVHRYSIADLERLRTNGSNTIRLMF